MRTKQQVVSEFRRTAIVDAARIVFARRGFAAGIMDEVAKEAGIAKGTIYLYFRSKDEVYKAVMDGDMKALNRNTVQKLDAAPSLHGKVRAFILARLENAEARKDFFRIMDSGQGSLAYTRKQYRDWLREPVQRLASAMDEAAQRGEIRRLPAEPTAWLIADMTRGVIQRRLISPASDPAETEADRLMDFIWPSLTAGK